MAKSKTRTLVDFLASESRSGSEIVFIDPKDSEATMVQPTDDQ